MLSKAMTIWLKNTGLTQDILAAHQLTLADLDEAMQEIGSVCRDAWQAGMMTGLNGNMSLRVGSDLCLVTASGIGKGRLRSRDLVLCDLQGQSLGNYSYAKPSSEQGMHLAIYQANAALKSVLHVHPVHFLALGLRVSKEQFLQLSLHEANAWSSKLGIVPDYEPGSLELAQSVAQQAALGKQAIYMQNHGLCAVAKEARLALAICEQFEHLAKIQLLALA